MTTVPITINYLLNREEFWAFAAALENLDRMEGELEQIMANIPENVEELDDTMLILLRRLVEAMNFLHPAIQHGIHLLGLAAYRRAQRLVVLNTHY